LREGNGTRLPSRKPGRGTTRGGGNPRYKKKISLRETLGEGGPHFLNGGRDLMMALCWGGPRTCSTQFTGVGGYWETRTGKPKTRAEKGPGPQGNGLGGKTRLTDEIRTIRLR